MNNKLYDIIEELNIYKIVELKRAEDNIKHQSLKIVFIPKEAEKINLKIVELRNLNKNPNANFYIEFIDIEALNNDTENIIFRASNLNIVIG